MAYCVKLIILFCAYLTDILLHADVVTSCEQHSRIGSFQTVNNDSHCMSVQPVSSGGGRGGTQGSSFLDADERERQRLQELERNALECMTPFLEALFENVSDPDPKGSGTGAKADGQRKDWFGYVHSMSYHATLRREVNKPHVLNHCPSTDLAPLSTRTAPASFTMFSHAQFCGDDGNSAPPIGLLLRISYLPARQRHPVE